MSVLSPFFLSFLLSRNDWFELCCIILSFVLNLWRTHGSVHESLALRLPAESPHETELFFPDGPFSLYHYSVLRQTSLAALISGVSVLSWPHAGVCHPAATPRLQADALFVIPPHALRRRLSSCHTYTRRRLSLLWAGVAVRRCCGWYDWSRRTVARSIPLRLSLGLQKPAVVSVWHRRTQLGLNLHLTLKLTAH